MPCKQRSAAHIRLDHLSGQIEMMRKFTLSGGLSSPSDWTERRPQPTLSFPYQNPGATPFALDAPLLLALPLLLTLQKLVVLLALGVANHQLYREPDLQRITCVNYLVFCS